MNMSQPASEVNAITTQPLLSTMNMAEPNPALENTPDIITTQPMMNDPNDEEQKKKKFSQFNPTMQQPEKRQQNNQDDEVVEDCTWCCFVCADWWPHCHCSGCDCDCTGCCDNNDDCCTGCCADGPSGDIDINGDDVAGCLECCGACFECCRD